LHDFGIIRREKAIGKGEGKGKAREIGEGTRRE